MQITPYDVEGLFNKVYCEVASIEKGRSGFKSTGIFPCQPDIFTDEDFVYDPTPVTSVDSEQRIINNGQITPETNKKNDATKNGISNESEHQKTPQAELSKDNSPGPIQGCLKWWDDPMNIFEILLEISPIPEMRMKKIK
ncbi:hypothetical protein JTB14_019094 [Gonioctena quinquepunctata]|nr:hypothetical protein JTB14_019094 [Gonioctena quinquepunctata]